MKIFQHSIFVKIVLVASIMLSQAACGSKKPKTESAKPAGDTEDTDSTQVLGDQQAEAQSKIVKWLGSDAAEKVSEAGKKTAKKLADKMLESEQVTEAIGYLIAEVFKQEDVKKKIDKIADKATSGVKNKLTLLGKAIASGGVSDYKKKVKQRGTEVAREILAERVQNELLKDERMKDVIKKLIPMLKIQGQLATATIQGNMSPRVSQKLFTITLNLAVDGNSDKTAQKVEEWIANCEGHAEEEMVQLLKKVGKLKSLQKAMRGLAVDVLKHPRMVDELSQMTLRILEDDDAWDAAVDAYKSVALDSSEDEIREKMTALFELSVINDEIFNTLNVLAEAEGASAIIEEHLSSAAEDEKMATLVEEFLVSLLDTCGELSVR
ncbi:MAG: hypothetical protein JXX14_09840 [Deltaproteobacteria bacterium]|nr:hypothetical protein [Deltaproteobacteria bacterium]